MPLAAIVEFTTDSPVTAKLTARGEDSVFTIDSHRKPTTRHRIVALGFHPGENYEIELTLRDKIGRTHPVRRRLAFQSPALPQDFPPLKCVVSKPARMEPGVTIFNVFQWIDDAANESLGYIIAVDSAGRVVWFYRADHPISDVKRLSNGNLLYMRQHRDRPWTQAVEIDMLGNVQRSWYAAARVFGQEKPKNSTPLNVDTLHHDVVETNRGTFLGIATEVRRLPKYPPSEIRPQRQRPANVVGDAIIEFRPDGTIVKRWPLLDLLDTGRIGYGSVSRFWDARCYQSFVKEGGTRDWSHANAIDYDPKTDTLVVSVRHQDAIIKINCKTGKLIWILANPVDWGPKWRKLLLEPKGKVDWPYHQHSPKWTTAGTTALRSRRHGLGGPRYGTLLVYDNGNYRATPPRSKVPAVRNASRAVEYAIDEKTRTVRQLWEYRGDDPVLCPLFGDVDRLKQTGNILVTDGAILTDERGRKTYSIPADRQRARIVELDRVARPSEAVPVEREEKVFELHIGRKEPGRYGWSVYRSERLPALSPGAKSESASQEAQAERHRLRAVVAGDRHRRRHRGGD